MKNLFMQTKALLSDCERYRYWLERTWDEKLPRVCWVMLNPSTADHQVDDATIRKVVGFSTIWGGGGVTVVNLFALRSTDPRALYKAEDPVGPLCDTHLLACAIRDMRVVVGWGCHGGLHGRDQAVLALLKQHGLQPECLGKTNGGHPRHPLYVAYETKLEAYP